MGRFGFSGIWLACDNRTARGQPRLLPVAKEMTWVMPKLRRLWKISTAAAISWKKTALWQLPLACASRHDEVGQRPEKSAQQSRTSVTTEQKKCRGVCRAVAKLLASPTARCSC